MFRVAIRTVSGSVVAMYFMLSKNALVMLGMKKACSRKLGRCLRMERSTSLSVRT